MIEIYSTNAKKEEKTKVKARKKTAGTVQVNRSFSANLQNSIQFRVEGTIEELMADLEEQEKKFLEKQTLFDFAKYKAIVQHILKTVVSDGFSTAVLKRSRSDRSDYLIVRQINDKIEEIQGKITSAAAFNLLKDIEEIRGLILDLMH